MYIEKIKKLGPVKLGMAGMVILMLAFLAKDAVIFYTFNPAGRYDEDIIMYTTKSCPYCSKLRQCFSFSNVPYVEKDIKDDILASLEHKALGGHGVPVVLVGESVIYGYSVEKLNDVLIKSNLKITCNEFG